MPTKTQHLEQRVAALQSDLNESYQRIDQLTFSDNDRELSRRSWFESAQAAEKRVVELEGLLTGAVKAWESAQFGDPPVALSKVMARAKAALSASAEPAAPRETPAPFAFAYAHPQTAERHTVTVTRDEVIEHMEEQLFQKLCECFCECQPVGETNVVDCRCDEVAEQFKLVTENEGPSTKLVEPDAPVAQYPNRLCHVEYTAHPYRCGCLKGDKEAQRIYDEHCKSVERDEQARCQHPNVAPRSQVVDGKFLGYFCKDCNACLGTDRAALERKP